VISSGIIKNFSKGFFSEIVKFKGFFQGIFFQILKMGLEGNLEDTPPNTVLDFRSDSPAIITKEQVISDKDANISLQTVKCSKCDRSFTIERIQKHEEICNKVKERKAYDIVKMRVKGTDTEALVKADIYQRNELVTDGFPQRKKSVRVLKT